MKRFFALVASVMMLFAVGICFVSCSDDDSDFSADTIIKLDTPKLKAVVNSSSISLKWNDVYGARAYKLVRYKTGDSSDTGTELESSTTNTSYTDSSSLTRGTKYTYKLTALSTRGGNDYGARTLYLKDSNAVSVTVEYGEGPYLPSEFSDKTVTALYTYSDTHDITYTNYIYALYFFNDNTWVYTYAVNDGTERAYRKGTYPTTANPSSSGTFTLSQTHSRQESYFYYNSSDWTSETESLSCSISGSHLTCSTLNSSSFNRSYNY